MKAASSANSKPNIFQFKVTVKELTPPVWRRIEIPENYTFYEFHIALQDIFKLSGHKWHKFEMGDGSDMGIGVCIGIPDEDGLVFIIPEKKQKISTKFNVANNNCIYSQLLNSTTDYVKLIIKFEGIFEGLPDVEYPRCVAGGRQYRSMKSGRLDKHKFCVKEITFRDAKEITDSEDSDFTE